MKIVTKYDGNPNANPTISETPQIIRISENHGLLGTELVVGVNGHKGQHLAC